MNNFFSPSYITPRITNAFAFSTPHHNLSQSHVPVVTLELHRFNRFLPGSPGY